MAKIKLHKKKVIKRYNGEVYVFIGGKARVPGTRLKSTGLPMVITLAEFMEFSKDGCNHDNLENHSEG